MDGDPRNEIIALYEAQPDLLSLPRLLFDGIRRLIDADVVSFFEFHHRSRDFRSVVSVVDDPERRTQAMQAFASHMHSHPFWQFDPAFFGERALRESDFFTEEEFLALPIAREVFLPSRVRHMIAVVLQHENYVVKVVGHRVPGRPAFSDEERDRFEAFRPHMLRSYLQAQERTLAKLTPTERLRLAFPQLTPRQLEVASLIASGKSNEEIAIILGTGIDAVKAHIKAIYGKIDSDNRRAMAAIAHTAPPFAKLPPLWKLDLAAWNGRRD
jgi:DNA-binding CsgD family transcriptional regulator